MPRKKGLTVDPALVAKVLALYAEGHSIRDTMRLTVSSYGTVRTILNDAGVLRPAGGRTEETDSRGREVVRLRNQGLTFGEIAKKIGLSQSQACRRYKELTGAPPRGKAKAGG